MALRGAELHESLFTVWDKVNKHCHKTLRRNYLGLVPYACEECGVSKWQGKELTLTVHHISGDWMDNRLENLALLCPNCHSQTETYGSKNKGQGSGRTRGTNRFYISL